MAYTINGLGADAATLADRVKAGWIQVITQLGLDEDVRDVQNKIPSSATFETLQALAAKADGVLAERKDPHAGVFMQVLQAAAAATGAGGAGGGGGGASTGPSLGTVAVVGVALILGFSLLKR